MKQVSFSDHVGGRMNVLPVLIPIIAVVALTGSVRLATTVTEQTSKSSIKNWSKTIQGPLPKARLNSTEATFAGYHQVSEQLALGDDATALKTLESVANAPVRVDGNSFVSEKIKSFSPPSLMMGLAHKILQRTTESINKGDEKTARKYINALYQTGDQFARTTTPTVASVQIAHYYHGIAAETEAKLASNGKYGSSLITQYHVQALQDFWRKHICPQLDAIHQREISAGMDGTITQVDQAEVARLSQEYQSEWSRIRAGEA